MDPTTSPNQRRRTSPWVYAAWGCAAVVLLGAGSCIAFVYFVRNQAKQLEASFKDPKMREEKTRQILAYRDLPEGYYPMGGISIPFLMDTAILSDRPAQQGDTSYGPRGDHMFIYMRMRVGQLTAASRESSLKGGNSQQLSWMRNMGLQLNTQQEIGRGTIQAGGATIYYATTRGTTHAHGRSRESLTSTLVIECPDHRLRNGIWMGPDPAAEQTGAAGAAELAGTPADPKAIETFANHFQFCSGS